MVESDDFLDEAKFPIKMVKIIIDNIQSFVIQYLKQNQQIYRHFTTKGFVKALSEILLRKFPSGVNHKHLLTTNQHDPSFFPWEELFQISDFKDNEIVIDARKLLHDTYVAINDKNIKLILLMKLIDTDNNRFSSRFCDLMSKVSKKKKFDEIKVGEITLIIFLRSAF